MEHNYYRTNCITKLSESQINNYKRVHYTNLHEISEIVAIVTNIYIINFLVAKDDPTIFLFEYVQQFQYLHHLFSTTADVVYIC